MNRRKVAEEGMEVAVCDDDEAFRANMSGWIQAYDQELVHLKLFCSGEELIAAKVSFDVIFLDIDMDGINGVETASRLRRKDKKVKIIYVTSYSDYVDGAFSVHAFSYILKPVSQAQIYQLLDEVLSYTTVKRESKELEFQTEGGLERLKTDEIFYFEYLCRKIIIHSEKGEFQFKGKIADVDRKMSAYGFASPHKSYVVNLYHVKAMKGYEIKMMSGDIVPISQKKSSEFRHLHSHFLAQLLEEETYG